MKIMVEIIEELRINNYAVTVLQGEGKDKGRNVLMIMVPRKKRREIVEIVNSIDSSSMIVAESATTISGGYNKFEKRK